MRHFAMLSLSQCVSIAQVFTMSSLFPFYYQSFHCYISFPVFLLLHCVPGVFPVFQCERLALMGQSYSEDAGQRCSLILTPELQAVAARKVYSQLHGRLERTFELFLIVSQVQELPRLPQPADPCYTSEVRAVSARPETLRRDD